MDVKVELGRAYGALLLAPTAAARRDAARALQTAAASYAETYESLPPPDAEVALRRDASILDQTGDFLDTIDDEALAAFNRLLPWAAMTLDRRGRVVGNAWSSGKRANFAEMLDRRLIAFDKEWPLKGRSVLEVGCFEGIHTLACLMLGASVTGVDGRMENILKTSSRLWAYGKTTPLVFWDIENATPSTLPDEWDMLHHIGVLYHLTNPVEHLRELLPRTRHALLLDTHVAHDDARASESYQVEGRTYRYQKHGEAHQDVNPFAGLRDHAKWLRLDDLVETCRELGCSDVKVVDNREERNGRRVTIRAFR